MASGPAVNGPAYSITRLDGTKLYAADVTSISNPTSPIVSDGGALWFSSLSPAVWRWADPSAGISQVATGPAQGAVVAGTCS